MGQTFLVIVLWVLAVAGIAGNVVASLDAMGPLVQLGFGIVALASIAGLVVINVRKRRARQQLVE